jgi:hypothetical protein
MNIAFQGSFSSIMTLVLARFVVVCALWVSKAARLLLRLITAFGIC